MSLIKPGLKYFLVITSSLHLHTIHADTIITRNGASLIGTVSLITSEAVTLETEYAGAINIDRDQISRLRTDASLSTKLADGTEVTGITVIHEDGTLEIENNSLGLETSAGNLLASWPPGDTPPAEAGYLQPRRWAYSTAADITGRTGNTEENGIAIQAEAVLAGERDELGFYVSVDRADRDGEETADEIIGGTRYVSYFSDLIGWYVNTEFERDPFENIDLRATLSGGLSYWLFNRTDHSLQLQTGAGYRHETFTDNTNQESPIIDINLHHAWQVNAWMRMTNRLSYLPSISDFEDFIVEQDSGINMPVGNTDWRLRLGLKNHYKNEPSPGFKKLDTTYYSRLIFNFD